MSDFRAGAKALSYKLFEWGQALGLNVIPNHYYVPLADLRSLRSRRHEWAKASPLEGVTFDIQAQAEALRRMVLPFQEEYCGNRIYEEATDGRFGPGYGPIEAQALHGVVRDLRPGKIVEVGSGVSTYCMQKAIGDNPTRLTCIEPYPSSYVRSAGVELVEKRVEQLDPAYFDVLGEGDLLFIDSSHAVRPGGDVIFLYLEVLPRLRPGVTVHIHDIYLPYQYQRNVDRTYMQWAETALLQALLVENARLEILFCLSMLHYAAPDVLREVFPDYRPQRDTDGLVATSEEKGGGHFPSSIYLRTR